MASRVVDQCKQKMKPGSAPGSLIPSGGAEWSLVEPRGVEPLTSAVRLLRSPN